MTEEMRRELAEHRAEMERRAARRIAKEEAEIKYRRANGKSDKTCAGCVRFKPVDLPETRDKDHSTGWHCCCRHYDAGILPSDPACKDWWDKEQYEREKKDDLYKKGYKDGWNSCVKNKADGWMIDYI